MRESENMNVKEESQENYSSIEQDMDSKESLNAQEAEIEEALNSAPEDSQPEESLEVQAGEEPEAAPEERKKKESKDVYQIHFETFLKEFQNQSNLEEKLQLAVNFMDESLAQGGTPHFRNFWEVRRLCLPLFKENISPVVRSQLWNKYSELSKEARRLKDLLDEQSAFATEQIEIAIKALEDDIENFEEKAQKNSLPEDVVFPLFLEEKRSFYEEFQQKLNILNVQASRINALRKELLKTEMRVRQKNKFFQRLSLAGDKVFPQRKELIKQISQDFIDNVDQFINVHFGTEETAHPMPLYDLREEIKIFQGLAKVLTLNTSAFTQTRTRLSEAWDQIKVKEKERKKERAQQRASLRQNAEAVEQYIREFKEEFAKETLSLAEAGKKLDEVVAFMRRTELDRDDLRKLREELNEARRPLQERARAEEESRHQLENERVRQKKEKYNSLKERIGTLISQNETYAEAELVAERDDVLAQIQESALIKTEKLELERLLKPLKDIITEKKEQAVMALSEDDREALNQLQAILQQRKTRRQEIKSQLETLRKTSGSSSLDFEKAMQYNAQINEEKERLEKINHGIKEIEDKIAKLKAL
jgi:hypothetical protein